MSVSDLERWNTKYTRVAPPAGVTADAWLLEQVAGLVPGRALELACGLGHNAIALARLGWQVDAVDISPVGLELATELARSAGVSVQWIAADLDQFVPAAQAYDLVVMFRFLDRVQVPRIVSAGLRPGGHLIYETFTRQHLLRPDSHLKNPDFTLEPGELPRLFPGVVPVTYDECALPGRDVARLVGRQSGAPADGSGVP